MATPWFRLWADMVNDPKWRTIARVSQQSVGNVVAVYVHMMTCASNAGERGWLSGWSDEDVATALDIETENVTAIRTAMQGRVLDKDRLTGWKKRQPVREDASTGRVQAFREREKQKKLDGEGAPAAPTKSKKVDLAAMPDFNKKNDVSAKLPLDETPSVTTAHRVEMTDAQLLSSEVDEIFCYWKKVMNSPDSVLDTTRIKTIKKALNMYSASDVIRAVRGCSKTPFNMGDNKQNTCYNGIDLILRDAGYIDKFIALDLMPARSTTPETLAETNDRVMRQFMNREAEDFMVIDMESRQAVSAYP